MLVVANQGLEDPALCREVCRREERTATEVMIVAPVVASSRLRALSDDVDRELELARQRVDAALQTLSAAGVQASGRADIAEPMDSLLDGLREFPPNEVVMLSGGEARWESAARSPSACGRGRAAGDRGQQLGLAELSFGSEPPAEHSQRSK